MSTQILRKSSTSSGTWASKEQATTSGAIRDGFIKLIKSLEYSPIIRMHWRLLDSCLQPLTDLSETERKLLAPCTIFNKSKSLLWATWFICLNFLSSQFTKVICFCWIWYKEPGVFCLSVSDGSVVRMALTTSSLHIEWLSHECWINDLQQGFLGLKRRSCNMDYLKDELKETSSQNEM